MPPPLRTFSYAPSADGVDENLLVLLHGFGDTQESMAALARSLALPQTAALALRAPASLAPLGLPGAAWHASFDVESGEPLPRGSRERAATLSASVAALLSAVGGELCGGRCGWSADKVFLLGYGQGGTVALAAALELRRRRQRWLREHSGGGGAAPGDVQHGGRLGGVVSLCGTLLQEQVTGGGDSGGGGDAQDDTPILILCGEDDADAPPPLARASAAALGAPASSGSGGGGGVVVLRGRGAGPLHGEHEVRPLMEFLAARLSRRLLALEGQSDIIEIGGAGGGGATLTAMPREAGAA